MALTTMKDVEDGKVTMGGPQPEPQVENDPLRQPENTQCPVCGEFIFGQVKFPVNISTIKGHVQNVNFHVGCAEKVFLAYKALLLARKAAREEFERKQVKDLASGKSVKKKNKATATKARKQTA